jgi:hypothetical protein
MLAAAHRHEIRLESIFIGAARRSGNCQNSCESDRDGLVQIEPGRVVAFDYFESIVMHIKMPHHSRYSPQFLVNAWPAGLSVMQAIEPFGCGGPWCWMLGAWYSVLLLNVSTLFASVNTKSITRLNFEVGMSSSCGSASCMECLALWRLANVNAFFVPAVGSKMMLQI